VRGVDHLFKLVRGTGTEKMLEALKDSSSTKEKIFIDVTEAELFAQKLNSNTEPSHHWYVEEYK
jgi:zona occludens toxin (predicted ATPase)